jgi:hypothetical protein
MNANVKKLAGMAAMATLVTSAGWGLAAGTAQADVGRDNHHIVHVFDRDRDRDHHLFDRDHDVDVFHHKGMIFGHFPDRR